MIPHFQCAKSDMLNLGNCLRHAIYLYLWGWVKYLPFPLCNYVRFAVLRLFASQIHSTAISDGVMIWFPWRVRIGRDSSLNQGCILDGFGGIEIGEGVRIAAYVTINTADHAYMDNARRIMDQGYVCAPVHIGDDVWIGTHTSINKGVTIGKGAVIGSGSVVTKDVPAYSVSVGNPCRVIRNRGDSYGENA
jgi:acetyltransferase-like isoleucine patch superfamily enzyme